MVKSCWDLLRNSHTRIDKFSHLSVSLLSSWCLMMVWKILSSELYVELGSGILPSLKINSSAFLPLLMRRIMSPPSSTIMLGMQPLPQSYSYINEFSMQPHYSSRLPPFQENITAYSSCIMIATVWSWVEKMLQEQQRRSLLRALRFSINNAVWMLIWIYTVIRAQPDISNICNIGVFVPIVSKVNVHVCTPW